MHPIVLSIDLHACLFEVMLGFTSRMPSDILPMWLHIKRIWVSRSICRTCYCIMRSTNKFKQVIINIKVKLIHAIWNLEEYIMVPIRPKWVPSETTRKLQGCRRPLKVVKQVIPNAYVVDVSSYRGLAVILDGLFLWAFPGLNCEPYLIQHP